jgi:ABC-type histidine transport system ATPase subunit
VAQHVVFLEEGRIAMEGTSADVFRRPWNPRLARFLETYLDRGASMLIAEG